MYTTTRIAREEIFGPVISAMPFDTLDEVIRHVATPDAAAQAVMGVIGATTIHKVARGLHTGTVWANCYQVMDPAIPFGGYKMSGFGRESGIEHVREYVQTKAVVLKLE